MRELNLEDYGLPAGVLENDGNTLPARVIAVHRERYQLVCQHGQIFGKLKSGVYFDGSSEEFPTAGDFVLIQYNTQGESPIVQTLPRKSYFPGRIRERTGRTSCSGQF